MSKITNKMRSQLYDLRMQTRLYRPDLLLLVQVFERSIWALEIENNYVSYTLTRKNIQKAIDDFVYIITLHS